MVLVITAAVAVVFLGIDVTQQPGALSPLTPFHLISHLTTNIRTNKRRATARE